MAPLGWSSLAYRGRHQSGDVRLRWSHKRSTLVLRLTVVSQHCTETKTNLTQTTVFIRTSFKGGNLSRYSSKYMHIYTYLVTCFTLKSECYCNYSIGHQRARTSERTAYMPRLKYVITILQIK